MIIRSCWRFCLGAFIFFCGSLACAAATTPSAGPKVVGYFAQWAGVNHVTPDELPADKLTHINYAFAHIVDGKCAPIDARNAEQVFPQLVALKKKNPQLKILVSVGGWTDSEAFSDAALTDATRQKFAQSCADFLKANQLDGVDIDWEFPTGGGMAKNSARPQDTHNFTLLLAAVRRSLDARGKQDHKRYLLTIASPASPHNYDKIELKQIAKIIDWFNLMTYDFAGQWSPNTTFNAPLFAPGNPEAEDPKKTSPSADASVRGYESAGVPAPKICLGVPFYGRAFQGVKDINHGLFQKHDAKGPKMPGGGEWSYHNIIDNVLGHGPIRYYSDKAKVPWLFDAKAGIFVTYDDPQSIHRKANYAKSHHLGGVMIWELSEDDPNFDMLNAVNAGLR